MNKNEIENYMLRQNLSSLPPRDSALPPDPPQFDLIVNPALREIRYAFVHWLDWCVVLASMALLEYCCKDKALDALNEGPVWNGPARLSFFKEHTFAEAINLCMEHGLLSPTDAEKLHELRGKCRNVISHMNAVEFGKDKVYPSMLKIQVPESIKVLKDVKAPDNPIASRVAFWEKINHLSIDLFAVVHQMIWKLYASDIEKAQKGEYGGTIFV